MKRLPVMLILCFLIILGLLGCRNRPYNSGAESDTHSNDKTTNPAKCRSNPRDVAIAEIERLGGRVRFEENSADKLVYSVNFAESTVTDGALKNVEELKELKALVLGFTKVTDAGLAHIEQLSQLRHLDLMNTRVTDAGMKHIESLCRLETLTLDNTQVTDVGLEQIKKLTQLYLLGLTNTRVTNAGLKHLTELRNLHTLGTDGTKVTSAGRDELKRSLPNLND